MSAICNCKFYKGVCKDAKKFISNTVNGTSETVESQKVRMTHNIEKTYCLGNQKECPIYQLKNVIIQLYERGGMTEKQLNDSYGYEDAFFK